MQKAVVSSRYGMAPIGGSVDGISQTKEHEAKENVLPGGTQVTITALKEAVITTSAGYYDNVKAVVVAIEGKRGWYMKSGFST